ncbi:MAG: hypothetical protein JXB49_32175 [Bacteroidales bacterium]|nr:hypothetical protein [Bacteroidales bacterium]
MEESFPATIESNIRRNKKLRRIVFIMIFVLMSVVYATIDYIGPKEIKLKTDNAFGLPCLRARGLIVQEYNKEGDLWASRGMIIYKLNKGSNKFTRIAHVPTGCSIFWLRNFSLFRRLTVRPECIEMVVTPKGDICALSAGNFWHLASGEKHFTKTLRLSHYGFGDQGIRNDGIVCVNDSVIYFGEYFQNPEKTKVNIFKSENSGRSWVVVREFQPGQIRHIHAIQKDPFSDKLWVCTGDNNEESMVSYSQDDFKTLIQIGEGSQIWRVCQLVFTEDAVYWGTDFGREEIAGIYRWDRIKKEVIKLQKTDAAMFFGTRLANGAIIMSTNMEEVDYPTDDKVRVWIVGPKDETISIVCGSWKHKKPGLRYKFAMLRFQRDQGSKSLAVTCLNIKEFPDGELLIFNENKLLEFMKEHNVKN